MPDDYERRRQESRDYENRQQDQRFFEESLADRSEDFYKALEGDDRLGLYNALGISPPANSGSDSPTASQLDNFAEQVRSLRRSVLVDVAFLPASLLKGDLDSSLANLTEANCTAELERLHSKIGVALAVVRNDASIWSRRSVEDNLSRVKESLTRLKELWSRYCEKR